MIIKDKITENSCIADDFCKDFDVKIPEFGIKMSCPRVLQKGIALSCSASDSRQWPSPVLKFVCNILFDLIKFLRKLLQLIVTFHIFATESQWEFLKSFYNINELIRIIWKSYCFSWFASWAAPLRWPRQPSMAQCSMKGQTNRS